MWISPWVSHVTNVNEPMNESCHTSEWAHEWVMSHKWVSPWMSHVTLVNEPMNESCHTCEWASFESFICAHASAPALSWVMSRVSKRRYSAKETYSLKESTNRSHPIGSFSIMSHVTRVNESYHTYGWVTWHIWTSHVTRMNESYLMMNISNVTERHPQEAGIRIWGGYD